MSTSIRGDLQNDLLTSPIDLCVTKWVLETSPFAFAGVSREEFWNWKSALAAKIDVDAKNILITGSGAVGVSLNPFKGMKNYDSLSDIDVAVISTYHFDVAWRALRNIGTRRFSLPQSQQRAIDEHVKRYIYWGTIATDRILPLLPFGKEWVIALNEMAQIEPTIDRTIKVRIYRDFASLRAYLVTGLKELRNQLLSTISPSS